MTRSCASCVSSIALHKSAAALKRSGQLPTFSIVSLGQYLTSSVSQRSRQHILKRWWLMRLRLKGLSQSNKFGAAASQTKRNVRGFFHKKRELHRLWNSRASGRLPLEEDGGNRIPMKGYCA